MLEKLDQETAASPDREAEYGMVLGRILVCGGSRILIPRTTLCDV